MVLSIVKARKFYEPSGNKIIAPRNIERVVKEIRERFTGKLIVVAGGTFDLLHFAHVALLEQAKDHGDILIVIVNPDEEVRSKKGEDRPVVGQGERVRLVAALGCVDYVVSIPFGQGPKILATIRPNLWARGIDSKEVGEDEPYRIALATFGIPTIYLGGLPGHTSEIIERVRSRRPASYQS